MRILVTGATGFIGRHVVQWLVNHNYTNIIATSTSLKKVQAMKWRNNVEYVQCNYIDEDVNYYEYFKKPELLIHLAWRNVSNVSDEGHLTKNLQREINFLDSFIQQQKTKIVVIGSCAEYGDINGCLHEADKTNPNTYYAIAKDTLRRYLELKCENTDILWNWIRVFYQYGDGQNPKSLLPQLNAAIQRGDSNFPMTNGEQLRDYLHVGDTAEYICKIALQKNITGVVNCCSGEPISVRHIVEMTITQNKSPIQLELGSYPYRDYEAMAFWGDRKKLDKCIEAFKEDNDNLQ